MPTAKRKKERASSVRTVLRDSIFSNPYESWNVRTRRRDGIETRKTTKIRPDTTVKNARRSRLHTYDDTYTPIVNRNNGGPLAWKKTTTNRVNATSWTKSAKSAIRSGTLIFVRDGVQKGSACTHSNNNLFRAAQNRSPENRTWERGPCDLSRARCPCHVFIIVVGYAGAFNLPTDTRAEAAASARRPTKYILIIITAVTITITLRIVNIIIIIVSGKSSPGVGARPKSKLGQFNIGDFTTSDCR